MEPAQRRTERFVTTSMRDVRHFLRRRHQVHSRGTNRFSKDAVFSELGVLQFRRPNRSLVREFCDEASRSRMRAIRTSGLMSGDGKRGGAHASVLAPILDSTK